MDTISGVLEKGIHDLQSTFATHIASFRQEIQPALDDISDVQSIQADQQKVIGSAIGRMAQGLQLIASGTFETRLRLPDLERDADLLSCSDQQSAVSVNPISLLEQIVRDTNHVAQQSGGSDASGPRASHSQPVPDPDRPLRATVSRGVVAVFTMETHHAIVAALWQEWNEGVLGRQSVREMLKAGLKKSEGQRKLYARRKIVIDEVERLADDRTEPPDAIVKAFDAYLSLSRMSVTKLQDLIKKRMMEGKMTASWLDD